MKRHSVLLKSAVSALIVFTLFSVSICKAQRILVFDRDAHVKRIRFRVHDDLSVRITNYTWISGEITDVGDSTILISDIVIPVSTINAIRYNAMSGGAAILRQVSTKFPAAGISLLAIYAINAEINKDFPDYSTHELIISGSLILSGPIAHYFTYHKHKINKHHRLKIIDVSIR